MNHAEASEIVRQLADGFDPITGKSFRMDSPYQHPQIVRALFVATQALERAATTTRKTKASAEHAGRPWSADEDRELAAAHDQGTPVKDLAANHKRSEGAIQARLVKLGKIPAEQTRFRVAKPDGAVDATA
jgi:hypothetical protein